MENIKELIKKADAGDLKAKYDLANCYYYGEGVEKDLAKAIELFKGVANLEEEDYDGDWVNLYCDIDIVKFILGELYYYGEGVQQDYKQAVHWLTLSDNENAKKLLADCYYYGLGIEKDYYKAFKYYKYASNAGHIDAEECLNRMLKEPHFNQDGELISFEELL